MAPIAPETVYTKTAKGILEIRNKTVKLGRELSLVFLSIDGKAAVGELLPRSGMTSPQLHNALHTLVSDGYIKTVAQSAQASVSPTGDEVDFNSPQAMAKLNMEAASRALAAADASKRAQAEARAALDARLREESEARARALAEARAQAESAAKLKAEDAARAAAEDRARAEAEANEATDASTRAQAEARARSAAAAVVRAQAEARVRSEAEARANVLAESKRAAEHEAREEALTRTRNEAQAQARAAAEARASEALEAQVQAMEGARAHDNNPQAQEAEAARARVRDLERAAERAREAARTSAEAEGRADEVPQPELDIADRVRQLNARAQAARVSREDATRRDSQAVDYALDGSTTPRGNAWPSLELGPGTTPTTKAPAPIAPSEMVDLSVLSSDAAATDAGSAEVPQAPATPVASAPTILPVVDLQGAGAPGPASEHLPGPLERAMAQMAARAQAAQETARAVRQEPPAEPPRVEPTAEPLPQSAAAENIVPTIDDEEPLHERLNIDRAAHDIIADTAAARKKTEAAQFGRNALSARQKRVQEDADRAASQARRQRGRKALVGIGLALLIAPLLAAAWLQFMPLNGYIPDAQRALSQRLNQPVSIATLRYVLLPTPRLVLEGVGIGGSQGVRIERVVAHVGPFAALSGATSFDVVEAENVEIEADVLGTIPAWTGGRTAGAIQTDRLVLKALKVKLNGAELDPLNGDIALAPNGTVRSAVFENPKVKLELTPQAEGVRVALNAVGWRVPYGPPVEFGLLNLRGLIDQRRVAAAEFTGRVAGGDIEGAMTARWGGPVVLEGEFKLQRVDLQELSRATRSSVAARGALRGTGRFAMQAADWKSLRANPRADVNFAATRGELTNIDILRAIQSPAVGAMRGGRSAFEELTGTLQVANGHYIFRNLELRSGPLNAGGTIDVGPADRLSGRIAAELTGRGARSTFVLGGTVQDPQLQR